MSSTTRNLFANLPPPAECLAILIGTAEITLFGLAGLADPPSFAKGFGLPIQNSSSSEKDLEAGTSTSQSSTSAANTQRGLILALAARNLEKGITQGAGDVYFRGTVDDRRGLFGCQVVWSAGGGVWTCDWVGELRAYWRRAAVLVAEWGLVMSLNLIRGILRTFDGLFFVL
jgi:hypothetical protein